MSNGFLNVCDDYLGVSLKTPPTGRQQVCGHVLLDFSLGGVVVCGGVWCGVEVV